MKRILIAGVSLLCLAGAVMAQGEEAVDYSRWQVTSDVNLTLTQNAYSDNWVGGETGSLSWTLNSLTVAEKQVLANVFNKNTLKMAYGLTYNQDPATDKWGSGDKSTDLIDLESTFRMTLGTFLEPILALRGITQFLDRSERGLTTSFATKERLFNPIELTESVGVAHVFFKDKSREWQTRVGVAAKQVIDRDRLDLTTGARETDTEVVGGFELVNDLKVPLAEDKIIWTSKLTVFEGLLSSKEDDGANAPDEDDFRYPDINFENIFAAQITRIIAVNLYVQMLYDREIDRAVRFKQTLALGLTYKLI